MRIISFSKKWDKLNQPEFTTFRNCRLDKDWQINEQVQVYYKSRSPIRERLGIAKIISKTAKYPRVDLTEEEAIADGFVSKDNMMEWLYKTYGVIPALMNKLTLRWIDHDNR